MKVGFQSNFESILDEMTPDGVKNVMKDVKRKSTTGRR